MRNAILIIVFFWYAFSANGQWVVIDSIPGKADFIEFDNLNNVYKIRKSEIQKFDENLNLKYTYSDKQLGNIGRVDVSYPLRPLVLYPDLNYLVILDNTLSNNRGKKNLLDYDIGLATLACASVQNHFWVYDAMEFALVRLDENLNKKFSTGNLSQILGMEMNPVYMVEFANKLYINNPKTGILVFDIFGTYLKTIPVLEINDFQVFENELIYLKNNKLNMYNMLLYETKDVEIPYICRQARMQKDKLVLLTEQAIIVLKNLNP